MAARARPEVLARAEAILRAERERDEIEERPYSPSTYLKPAKKPHTSVISPRIPHFHPIRDVPLMGDSIGSDTKSHIGSICGFVRIRTNGVLSTEQYALTCYHVVAGIDRAKPFLADPTAFSAPARNIESPVPMDQAEPFFTDPTAFLNLDGVIESPAHIDRAVLQDYFTEKIHILQTQALETACIKEKYSEPFERELLEYLASRTPDDVTQRQEYEDILGILDNTYSLARFQRDIIEMRQKARLVSSSNITLGTVAWSSGLVEAIPLQSDDYSEKCLMDYALIKIRQDRLGANRLGAQEHMWDGVTHSCIFNRGDGGVEQDFSHVLGKDLPEEYPTPTRDVVKFGRTTKVTIGKTKMRRLIYKRPNGRILADYAISNRGRTKFSDRGDSGSPVLSQGFFGGLVGMLTGDCDDVDSKRDVSFFLPFRMIQADFEERFGAELVWERPPFDKDEGL